MSKRILSVSYDEPLLRTRELLLSREGYSVTSALGFIPAMEECKKGKFDLFILGHSIPDADKRELINTFRASCPSPVLALRRQNEDIPDGADDHVDPHDAGALLKAVSKVLSNGRQQHKTEGRDRPN